MELLGGLAVKEWKNILNWFCNLVSHFPNKTGASEKHINIFVTLKPLENPLFYKSNVYDNFSTYLYVKLQGYKSFCKPSIAFVFLSGSKQYAVSVNKTDKCLLFKCAYPFTIKRSRRSRVVASVNKSLDTGILLPRSGFSGVWLSQEHWYIDHPRDWHQKSPWLFR